MSDESFVLGISIIFLTVFAISSAGAGTLFQFNFNYANQTITGEKVGLGLDEWESQSVGDPFYYDEANEKLRINSSYNSTTRPSIRYVPNVSNFESYVIEVEIPEEVVNGSEDTFLYEPRVSFKQGLIYTELENGTNIVNNYGSGDFEIRYFDAHDDLDLYRSNITSVDVRFPSEPETGAVNLFRQFQNASSGYSYFNIIFLGAVGIFFSYLLIKIARGI
jgi:hypothetical protein